MIFLVLSPTLQQQNEAKNSKGTQLVPRGYWLGPSLSGLKKEMEWYNPLFITENTHWWEHSLHVPKPKRSFSTPAKAPATQVAKRGSRKKKKGQKNSLSMRSVRKSSQLLQLQCFSSWSQLRHLGRNTSRLPEMPPNKTLPGHLERMLLEWQDLFPN